MSTAGWISSARSSSPPYDFWGACPCLPKGPAPYRSGTSIPSMRSHFSLRLTFAPALLLALACSTSTGPGIRLDVSPSSVQLVRNDTVRLSVTALDGDGHLVTGVAVAFASDDTTIATVSNLGLVRSGTVLGSTIVRVRGGGAFTDVPVTVTGTATQVTVSPPDTAIAAGATVQLTATARDGFGDPVSGASYQWSSLNPTVATVSATGLVHSEGRAGIATIQATTGTISGAAQVTVLDSLI